MALSLTKSYTPASGQTSNSTSYNTDMASLFNALNGLDAQTSSLGGLTITPSSNTTSRFTVNNAAGTAIVTVDTTNSKLVIGNSGTLTVGGKIWEIIAETDIAAAVANYDFTGLAGNTDKEYMIIARVVAGTANNEYLIRFGTGATPTYDAATNYGNQNVSGSGSTASASQSSGANGMYVLGAGTTAGNVVMAECKIYAASGYIRSAVSVTTNDCATTVVGSARSCGASWNNSADEITAIRIMGNQGDAGLGIGTHLELWARR